MQPSSFIVAATFLLSSGAASPLPLPAAISSRPTSHNIDPDVNAPTGQGESGGSRRKLEVDVERVGEYLRVIEPGILATVALGASIFFLIICCTTFVICCLSVPLVSWVGYWPATNGSPCSNKTCGCSVM